MDDLGGEVLRDHLVLPGLVAQLVQEVAVGQGVGVPGNGKTQLQQTVWKRRNFVPALEPLDMHLIC